MGAQSPPFTVPFKTNFSGTRSWSKRTSSSIGVTTYIWTTSKTSKWKQRRKRNSTNWIVDQILNLKKRKKERKTKEKRYLWIWLPSLLPNKVGWLLKTFLIGCLLKKRRLHIVTRNIIPCCQLHFAFKSRTTKAFWQLYRSRDLWQVYFVLISLTTVHLLLFTCLFYLAFSWWDHSIKFWVPRAIWRFLCILSLYC